MLPVQLNSLVFSRGYSQLQNTALMSKKEPWKFEEDAPLFQGRLQGITDTSASIGAHDSPRLIVFIRGVTKSRAYSL